MRKVTLFIAMSLDGFIADKEGSVDWLSGQEPGFDDMASYTDFIQNIDTVIMGWNTYHQIATELSPEEWIYSGMDSHVITHRNLASTEEVHFTPEHVCSLVESLRQEEGQGIWICGGAGIVQPLVRENRIDQYFISVIPVILGSGIRLFGTDGCRIPLKWIGSHTYNGITDLIYERREHTLTEQLLLPSDTR